MAQHHDVIMINYAGQPPTMIHLRAVLFKKLLLCQRVGLIKQKDGDLSAAPKFTKETEEEDKKNNRFEMR